MQELQRNRQWEREGEREKRRGRNANKWVSASAYNSNLDKDSGNSDQEWVDRLSDLNDKRHPGILDKF